jgi:asparagine synthetase B (glutamine-hydrolysing)
MTDVPFGVLLSGGLDSSLVAAVTARHLAGTKAARQWGAQLHSFCVGLEVIVNSCRKKFSIQVLKSLIESLILSLVLSRIHQI